MLIAIYKERDRQFQKAYPRMLTGWMLALSLWGSLVLTTCVQASPTTNMNDLLSHSSFSITQEPTKFLRFVTLELVGIDIETVRPHIASAISGSSQTDAVKSLPAVPTAVLMALIGFLCVSMVRDRRVWLAALSAILWTGWASIRTVPQLASHFCPKTHAGKYFATGAADFYLLKNTDHAHCDIEDTRYISLLNYLAGIPDNKRLSQHFCQAGHANILEQCKDRFRQSKLLTTNSLFPIILLTCRLVPITELFVYFKPAFIFQTLSRGPPETASEMFYWSNTLVDRTL